MNKLERKVRKTLYKDKKTHLDVKLALFLRAIIISNVVVQKELQEINGKHMRVITYEAKNMRFHPYCWLILFLSTLKNLSLCLIEALIEWVHNVVEAVNILRFKQRWTKHKIHIEVKDND